MSESSEISRESAKAMVSPWAILDSCEIVEKWLADNVIYLKSFPPEHYAMVRLQDIKDSEQNSRRLKPLPMHLYVNLPDTTNVALSPDTTSVQIPKRSAYGKWLRRKAEMNAIGQPETSAANHTDCTQKPEKSASTSDNTSQTTNGPVTKIAKQREE
ncbi:uncharacterized protein [Choristoneura fumiferana]|uniref:uncharacterized protein n=1 Tax=Choristoneura fumiferana TaxID=7141 RepID=UPI003D1586B5